jgi:hypothetical protein
MLIPLSHDELCDFFEIPYHYSPVFHFCCNIKNPKTGNFKKIALRFAENMRLVPINLSSFDIPINIYTDDDSNNETVIIYEYSITKDEKGYNELTGCILCSGESMNYSILMC